MQRLFLLALILSVLAVPLAGVQGQSDAFETVDCSTFDVPANFATECGYLTVPEEHANPDGNTIRLGVVIYRSISAAPAPDPIVLAQGGPGGSTIDLYNQLFSLGLGDDLLATRDVILLEQRGTLYSEPNLLCEEAFDLTLETIEQNMTIDETTALQLEALGRCRERLISEGINLNAYDSVENAADVALLRAALGLKSYNFYGVSYGTMLAQHLLRNHPEGLRSVIMDANAPLSLNFLPLTASTAQRSLNLIFEQCAADPDCAAAYPDLENQFYALVAQLNEEPIIIPLTDLESGQTYDAVLNGDTLIGTMFQMLYAAPVLPQIPKVISDLSQGEFGYLQLVLPSFIFERTMSVGMQYSVLCAEDADFVIEDQIVEGVRPEVLEVLDAAPYIDLCALWQVEALDSAVDEAVTSDVPVLIMAGEFDPITPPSNGELIASTLNNAYFYTFPAQSHGVFLSGQTCADQVAISFLADPANEPDASCLTQMQPLDFVITGVAPEFTLAPVTIESLNATTVMPDNWQELLPATFGESISSSTALIIQQIPVPMSLETAIQNLATQLGISEIPSAGTTIEGNGYTWTVLDMVEVQGVSVTLALSDIEGTIYLVLLQAPPDQMEELRETLLRPVLENFQLQ